MIEFKIMEIDDYDNYSKELFSVLAENMTKILPTGNTYDKDYKCWNQYFRENIRNCNSKTILILNDNLIIGFFHYSIVEDIFYMGEIQILSKFQGKEIFRDLYGFVLPLLPNNVLYVDSYANKVNIKSNNILKHLGLKIIGENKSGSGYRYRGDMSDLLKWYNKTK